MYLIRSLLSSIFSHPEVTAIGLALIAGGSYVAYRRAQKGVRVTKYLIGFIVCIALSVMTTSKLYTMYQIRGSIGGASTVTYSVRQKWEHEYYDRSSRAWKKAYWVTWTDQNIQEAGLHRVSLDYGKWSRLNLGDPVEITYVPGDPAPYVRGDVFASDGSFFFDYILLIAELSGATWFMFRMVRYPKRRKKDSEVIRLFK